MRKIITLILLLPIMGHCEILEYPPEIMEKVYASIYDHIKLYYPDNEIAVSCSLEDSSYALMSGVLYGKRKQLAFNDFLKTEYKPDMESDTLHRLFSTINDRISNPDFELWFSYPRNDIISCSLYDYGKRNAIFGQYINFIFGFTPEGDIDFMSKNTIDVN